MSSVAFEYVALDRLGAQRRGVAQAASREAAFRQVAAAGLTPVTIRELREKRQLLRKKVKVKDISHFTHQLAVLTEARIPLSDGLKSIGEQENNPTFREIILDVAKRIESGERLSIALAPHRKTFGDIYIETVEAAEKTGNLIKVLEHLGEMLEKADEVRQQVKSALTYPVIVLIALALGVSFLIGFVVPKFAAIFATRGVELPIFTKILIWLGETMQSHWWMYLLSIGAAVYGLRRMWLSTHGRLILEDILHRVPYIKSILRGAGIGRFTRILGLSLSSGLGVLESLEAAGRSCGRPRLNEDAQRLAEQVRTGGRLSAAMLACRYLSPFAKRMLSAGEESAELPRMCGVVARHYDRETSYLTKNIATFIEPVMVVLIAGVVLVVALAIFLPMWDMVTLIG
ncbi:MAG: type II secretion system F family protein [Phycisphaerales bacterium]|nr:type II secretion system F family protein [Phycisphaerales bacterium]